MKEITPIYLITLAWKRLWAIILAFVVFGAAAFSYCKFLVKPVYAASASVIVTNGAIVSNTRQENGTSITEKVSGGDISASLYLAETIIDILNTPDIYEAMEAEVSDYTASELMAMANIERRSEDTLFVDVSFNTTDPEEAKNLSNTFVNIACEYIAKFIPYSNAMVASTAHKATKVSPSTVRDTLIAGILGAALVYLLVLFLDQTNQTISDEEDFVNNFEVPLLGAVPDFEEAENVSGYDKKGGYVSGY